METQDGTPGKGQNFKPLPCKAQIWVQPRQANGITRLLRPAAFAAVNVPAQDHSLHAGEIEHCIFNSPMLRSFLLIQGFPCFISEVPGDRLPCRKPSPSCTPCPAPGLGHMSISPQNTHPAAFPIKSMWVLNHRLISITAHLGLSTPSPTLGFPQAHLSLWMGSSRGSPLLAGMQWAGYECTAQQELAFRQKCSWSPGTDCIQNNPVLRSRTSKLLLSFNKRARKQLPSIIITREFPLPLHYLLLLPLP